MEGTAAPPGCVGRSGCASTDSVHICFLLFLVRLLVFDRLIEEVVQVVDLILSCASLLFFSVLGVPSKAIVLCRNKIKLNHLV